MEKGRPVLEHHLEAVEEHLLSISKIPAGSGHSLHKGTPREAFIREFLANHLSEKVAVGTGEVISRESVTGEARNQHDVVIYKPEYPRLDFGGDIRAFLVESVVSTIEVKSTLTESDVENAVRAAQALKSMPAATGAFMRTGWIPSHPLSFIVAYDGPAKMQTVKKWLDRAASAAGFDYPDLPSDRSGRLNVANPGMDAVFVLGRGFVQFDNFPVSFIQEEHLSENDKLRWTIASTERGSLLMLFLMLMQAVAGSEMRTFEPIKYLDRWKLEDVSFGE